LNTTKEKGDGNKLPLPSLLQKHHKRRRHIAIMFFFFTTPPQKKTTTHCRRLLLLKHKEDKTHKKTTKKNQEKGRSLPSSFCFAFSLLVPVSTFLFQTLSPSIFFFSSKKIEKNTKKKKS
jgi:hypothetical protein